jgi:hypothetical protein
MWFYGARTKKQNKKINDTVMKKLITTTLIASMIALILPQVAKATITTDYNANITAIFGTGNPNNGWTEVTDTGNNLQLGLRAKERYGSVGTQNGSGNYSFAPGTDWNIEFSINTDPSNAGGISLASTGYSYWLDIDNILMLNIATLFSDNQYGNNGTANGAGAKGTFAALGGSNIIMQNSELYKWLGIPAAYGDEGHTFDLQVKNSNGCLVAGDQITVNGGLAAVPEPSTFAAAALLLLPLGAGFRRVFKKRSEK